MKRKHSYGIRADMAMRTWIEIVRAFSAVRARENAFVEVNGLTIQQFGVLEALYHMGELTVGELTKLVISTPGNMTVVLKNLKQKELIETVRRDDDKRVTVASITQKGRALIADIFPTHALNMEGYFECLTEEEQDSLAVILRKLRKANIKQA
ncbi:MarR family winged helix-turn-helix transcriptional regulator [Seleniivibrio woodruffii]|uniref:MarR family 2-MHQ and catechol resistance regulon transcriptional repressor n=2 Tax=Seleniivibrio woodruffii TaxID=1078050 RepID=A0A4R1K9X4_9BACT|nr:MarR family transcriptional regulator [Seleniivibrio woodruffii]TCK59979.1 MarR family 2-MHQ and catechol resistance regulon transcriptional repressor [Seleniivibrio woodruffii]TVZ35800.1 MarR family 2-MHQ and catechol resistance regulon transcriptional repressor [Seleniivibrio woodruffii]